MEFDFDLNKVLPNIITFIDCKRSPFRNHAQDTKLLQKQLDKVIDNLGTASSKTQGLHSIITSAGKLQHSDHELYILKDTTANGGRGAAIGMIKVGRKTLFLLDIHGIQNEVIPLCVMDFYVHHSCQRTGYGKKLFEYMLKIHNLQPSQVAIDRPSQKFLSFLKKHYGLQNSVSQPNNFLVFDQFFRDLSAVGYVPRRSQRTRTVSGNPSNRPPVHPYRRIPANSDEQQSSSQPPRRLSSRRSSRKEQPMEVDNDEVITKTVLPALANRRASGGLSAGSVRSTPESAGSRESSADSRGLAAQASLYSRHGSTGMARGIASRSGQMWSRNAVSAGTKSLHTCSQDNPLAIGRTFSSTSKGQPSLQSSNTRLNSFQQKPLLLASNKQSANSLSSTGNYTLSSVVGSQTTSSGSSSSRGTAWNVFGIPPVNTTTGTKSSNQAMKYGRTFHF